MRLLLMHDVSTPSSEKYLWPVATWYIDHREWYISLRSWDCAIRLHVYRKEQS